ncbi:MAG: ferritin-like domain-containing protein [Edaphobacter sp.]
MKEKTLPVLSSQPTVPSTGDEVNEKFGRVIRRRSFLQGLGMATAAIPTAALLPAGAFFTERHAHAEEEDDHRGGLSRGDAAILRFLAAAELIESDLWQQYNELGGVKGGNPAYIAALENLDSDMPQYITDNTDDELSHAAFLNAYLKSKGAQPVDLDRFRHLPSSQATGAKQIGRLTNLLNLNVDLSWYTRYRSKENPDLGGTFKGPFTITNEPAIPLNDTDTPPHTPQPNPPTLPQSRRMQAIANTAGFHFAFIEQGGSSLYTNMALKASSLEVLRIVVSIGGVEVDHFSLWHDKAGNATSGTLAHLVDPVTGLTFPDLNAPPTELTQTNKILPEPCDFLKGEKLPPCSVIRPSSTANAGAVAAVKSLTDDLLFVGQSEEFLDFIMQLAVEADAAQRDV